MPESIAGDAAAFLGESTKRELGGEWVEDPLLGLVLAGIGGAPRLRLRPYECIQKKWALRGAFRIAEFTSKLPARIEAERKSPAVAPCTSDDLLRATAGSSGNEADAHAARFSEEWRSRWKMRFGQELPASLRGLREVDAFLRTHYLVFGLSEGELACAGFYAGEISRGLFGGQWDFRGAEDISRVALVYPELRFYPVGRIFKMMIELPEGDPLDEYARMVPSARQAVRSGTGASP